MSGENQQFATRCIHAGQSPDPTTGAIMTPIYQTSTYVQTSPGEFIENYDYSRSANPTRTALEANVASLEGGKHGIAFSSGVASLAACIHLLKSGDHVLLCDDVYGGTFRMFNNVFAQLGIQFSRVDMTDLDATRAAMTDQTKLVWLETPTNPTLKVIDIEAVAQIAHDHGALCVADNTFASPYLQNPLALGADIVSHSCTKYLGGHSDLVGGILLTSSSELAEKLHYVQNAVGAVPAPMDCFLLLRSTKTLHVRMERHCENAGKIADWLTGQDGIERVIYPGLDSHPQHRIAAKQMRGFGGMITMTLKGGLPASRRFLETLKLFSLAESLGGVESLVEHPAIMTHASVDADKRAALGIDDGLVRLSCGIEDAGDLIADLEQALDAAKTV
ncbi:cystathionine gamma-synthase [Hyphobacterium sp. HN65]|uniref:Cystathionine gamma-synthase n=1 Tax=Hyphobacterium lacteum TaxID=3116575 RepID=A0ABU7LRQ8_9PROT|nr:cystathionine gamma-synthase [Hyphobacterium sp. HN65]MEE2526602.1 cystathionine gamma-synthase [Hyphobacterium sp. HN65]